MGANRNGKQDTLSAKLCINFAINYLTHRP